MGGVSPLDTATMPEQRPDQRIGARLAAALLARSSPTALELLTCGALLLALGAGVFAAHVRDGGFYSDDWAAAAEYQAAAAREEGVLAALAGATNGTLLAFRPVLALVLPLPHALFGLEPRGHLALAVMLAALASLCLYWLLRTVSVERLHAGAIAALVLIFPWSDATRLWATASANNLAVCFYLLGTLLAVRGLHRSGRRALAVHAGAISLYLLSVLTYEVTALAILGSGLLYAACSTRPAALRRWPWDVAAVGTALALVGLNTPREVRPPSELVVRAGAFADEGLSVLAAAAMPFWAVPRPVALGVLAAVIGAAAVLVRSLAEGDPDRDHLRRWLALACAGAIGVVAGYAMFLPGEDHYSPLKEGLSNRVNLLAGLGHVTLVYSAAVLAAALAARASSGGGARAAIVALPALTASALALGYASEIKGHMAGYARTTDYQGRLLTVIRREVRAPSRATIYTFGHRTYTAPGLAAFRHWDLKGAVRVALADPTLDAYPIYPGVEWVCGAGAMYPRSRFYSREQSLSTYGKGVWVDFASGRAVLIRDRSQCLAMQASFRPGTWS